MLSLSAAAELLNVSPEVLNDWVGRFDFPCLTVGEDGEGLYSDRQLKALREALATELSVASAISKARAADAARPPLRCLADRGAGRADQPPPPP
jgi:hypothetical protein